MNRRGFLQSCIALAAAPAIVRADSLMRIVPRDRLVWTATFEGAASRLVPTCLVLGTAHDRATQDRILDYLPGALQDQPPEVRDAVFSYDQPITFDMPPVNAGIALPITATVYIVMASALAS